MGYVEPDYEKSNAGSLVAGCRLGVAGVRIDVNAGDGGARDPRNRLGNLNNSSAVIRPSFRMRLALPLPESSATIRIGTYNH